MLDEEVARECPRPKSTNIAAATSARPPSSLLVVSIKPVFRVYRHLQLNGDGLLVLFKAGVRLRGRHSVQSSVLGDMLGSILHIGLKERDANTMCRSLDERDYDMSTTRRPLIKPNQPLCECLICTSQFRSIRPPILVYALETMAHE